MYFYYNSNNGCNNFIQASTGKAYLTGGAFKRIILESGQLNIASAVTDLNGNFTLSPVPVGVPFPVVIRVGKWRRVITIPSIAAATVPRAVTSMPAAPDNARLQPSPSQWMSRRGPKACPTQGGQPV